MKYVLQMFSLITDYIFESWKNILFLIDSAKTSNMFTSSSSVL